MPSSGLESICVVLSTQMCFKIGTVVCHITGEIKCIYKNLFSAKKVSCIYMCWLDLTSSEEPCVCIGTPSTLFFNAM